MQHAPRLLHNRAIRTFCHAILLRSPWSSPLGLDTCVLKKLLKLLAYVLPTPIASQSLQAPARLVLHECLEGKELLKHLPFPLQHVDEGVAAVVIDEGEKVEVAAHARSLKLPAQISVHKVEHLTRALSALSDEGTPCLFPCGTTRAWLRRKRLGSREAVNHSLLC